MSGKGIVRGLVRECGQVVKPVRNAMAEQWARVLEVFRPLAVVHEARQLGYKTPDTRRAQARLLLSVPQGLRAPHRAA